MTDDRFVLKRLILDARIKNKIKKTKQSTKLEITEDQKFLKTAKVVYSWGRKS